MKQKSKLVLGIQRMIVDLELGWSKYILMPCAKLIDKTLLFTRLNHYLNKYDASTSYDIFCTKSHHYFGYHVHDHDSLTATIPETGPCVVIANHPTGFAESMILPELILRQRKDLKILANAMLERLITVKPHLIPIDVYSKNSIKVIRSCHNWLKNGGVLFVFPSGEISDYDSKTRSIHDSDWSTFPVSLAKTYQAPIIHCCVEAKNSRWFYWLSKINRTARVALLSRELYNKKGVDFNIYNSSALSMTDFKHNHAKQLSDYLYHLNYALKYRDYFSDIPAYNKKPPLYDVKLTIPNDILERARDELQSLPENSIIYQLKSYTVYNLQGKCIPHILTLIEYEREITFRHAGMGTGEDKDGDEFDLEAYHLFAWDQKKNAFVGAYRYQLVTQADSPCYFANFFEIAPKQWSENEQTLVCSRTFISQSYQKSFVGLMSLWRSLAKAVVQHTHVRYMAGLVSIADHELPEKLTDLVALYTHAMAQNHPDIANNFKPNHPYTIKHEELPLEIEQAAKHCQSIQQLENLFLQLTNQPYKLPLLFNKYEDLGFKFFHTTIDPLFSNCIDVLGIWDIKENFSEKAQLFFDQEGIDAVKKRFDT